MKKPSFALLFFTLSACLSILTLLKPAQLFSDREQRNLNQFSDVSLSSLYDGSFQAQSEKALSDQFFLRDGFVQLQRHFQRLLGTRIINNVWIANPQLYQNSSPVDPKQIRQLSEVLNAFAIKNKKLRLDFLLVPTANGVIKNSLFPMLYESQREVMHLFAQQLDPLYHTIDTLKVMDQNKDEPIFYQGDHHWTTYGAYAMFQAWQKERGFNDQVKYNKSIANDAFYGTLSNASGIDRRDTVEIYTPIQNQIKTMVTYVQEQKRTATLYDESKQYSANPYELFLGGNFARIDIQTTVENDRNLLLIKDSYANCFIPFLVPYYHKIIVIDPRFYYDSLQSVVQTDHMTDILFLVNAHTLFQDSALYNLMNEEMNAK